MSTRAFIIGGHGQVSLLLEPLLTTAGVDVTATVRNSDHQADVKANGATPVVADVETLGADELTELMRGNDVVVWSAGAGADDAARTYTFDRDTAIRSIDAAVAAGVKRYVMVSYYGAGPDHGVPSDNAFFAYADAKSTADAYLRASSLEWTIVAPSLLTDEEPTGRIDVSATEVGAVPRADVAAVLAAVVAEPATAGRTIRFNTGDAPITEAIIAA